MRKILLLLPIAFLLFQSCSSTDNNSSNNNSSNPSGGLLLKDVKYLNDLYVHFEYNDNKLSKETFFNGSYGIYTYSGNLITQINYYNFNNSLVTVKNFYYVNNELVKSTLVEISGGSRQIDYVYSSGGKVVLNYKTTDKNGIITNGSESYYYSNGNIVNIESSGKLESHSHDTKNSPWKNITGYIKLNTEFYYGDNLFVNSNNTLTILNPIRSNSQSPINFSYQYNAQDYPISCTQSQSGESSITLNYTYY